MQIEEQFPKKARCLQEACSRYLLDKYFCIAHQYSILLCIRCNGASILNWSKSKIQSEKELMSSLAIISRKLLL